MFPDEFTKSRICHKEHRGHREENYILWKGTFLSNLCALCG
jgi:hypothetical protein